MTKPGLGDRELDVLRCVSEREPISAREVAELLGGEFGVARTTVVTLMERLRKKGYLARRRKDGIYRYSARVPSGEAVQGLVRHFIQQTLGGSVSPLFAYLSQSREMSEAEKTELLRLADELRKPEE